jgi:predicted XRE-type DNA-binding protein
MIEREMTGMTDESITTGTGNVFADLGRSDPADRQTKTRLAMALNDILAERKLRQTDAAKLLGIPQPRISALVNYRLNEFSVEKLIDLLTVLEQDVEIMIRRRPGKGTGSVSVLTVR